MKLSTTVLPIAFLCAASVLGAAAIQGTQTPEKATAVPASMPTAQPTREHSELLKLVGTWDCTMTMTKPGEAAQTSKATLVYKPVGELWVASEISGEMMGTPYSSRGFEGFDTEKKKVVSVSVDSMTSEVKSFEGTYDPATKTTTLTGKCRDLESGKVLEHRVVSKLTDDNTMVCQIFTRGDDGKETEVGKMESKRRK